MLEQENLTTSCNKDIFTYTSDYEDRNDVAEDNESNLFLPNGTDEAETELEKRVSLEMMRTLITVGNFFLKLSPGVFVVKCYGTFA